MHSPSRADPVVVCGAALCLGGFCVIAPGEMAVLLVVLLAILRAAHAIKVGLVAIAMVTVLFGATRAAHAVRAHEAARRDAGSALGPPKLCSAHARAVSSPVQARGVLRWDAELSGVVCDEQATAWQGAARRVGLLSAHTNFADAARTFS